MSEYLDSSGRDRLGRALYRLEVLAPELDAALVSRHRGDEVVPGRCSRGPGSRPPLSIPVLDVKYAAELSVCGWACNLAADLGCEPPAVLSIASAAAWLHERIYSLSSMPWAQDCLVEVCEHAAFVDAAVNPPPSASGPLPPLPERGSARQVSEALALLGVPLSHTTLRRLAKSGAVSSIRRSDGVDEFELAECKRYAMRWHEATQQGGK